MRTGELLALTWDDINFENRKIIVNKTVYSKLKDEKGRWYLGTTKTENSCREVYICDTLYKALNNFKKYQIENQKIYKEEYYNYYLEEIKNKYGKIIEYKVCELKHKSKNRKDANLVFTKRSNRSI